MDEEVNQDKNDEADADGMNLVGRIVRVFRSPWTAARLFTA